MKRQFDEPQLASLSLAPSGPHASIQASPFKRLNPVSINRRFSKKPRLGGYDEAFADDLLSGTDGFPYNAVAICDSFAESSQRGDDFFGPSASTDFEGCDRNSEPGNSPISLHPPQELRPPSQPTEVQQHQLQQQQQHQLQQQQQQLLQQRPQQQQQQPEALGQQAQPKTASEAPQPKEVDSQTTSATMRSKPEPERLIAETKMDIDMDDDDRHLSAGDESPEPPSMSRPFPCIWLDSSQEPLRCKEQQVDALKVHNLHNVMVTSSDMRNGSDGVAHETGSQPSDDETRQTPQPPSMEGGMVSQSGAAAAGDAQHRSAMEQQSMMEHHMMERSAHMERSALMERSQMERSQMERSPLERSPMDRLDRSPLERSPLERSQMQQQQQQQHQQSQQQHSPTHSQQQQHQQQMAMHQAVHPQRSPHPHDQPQQHPHDGPPMHPQPAPALGGGPHAQNGFPVMKEGLTPSPLKNGLSPHHHFNGLPAEGTTVVGPDGEQLTLEVCPECNKVFKRRVYLQRHMEREHWSTAKVFKCSDCSYETKHQSNLSVHRRIHTGERPYNCGACGQTYTQGHLLKSHIRSRHGGNMEFYNLDKTNSERPYHCGACGQRYTQGHLLKSHIRSRHEGNMEFYNLDKKGESTRGRKSLDPKHDPAAMMQQKQEKINSLVAQIERQKMSQMMGSHNMASFLGANIPPYMNAALRPFMGASPLALGNNMMGGPRLFTIGNMQNMQNGMIPIQAGLSMLGHNALSMSMESGGIKVPLKVPEVPSPISFQHQEGGPKITVIDDSIPQDLTTKKTPPLRSPPLRSPTSAKSPSSVLREVNGTPTTPNNNFNNSRFYNNFHKDEHMEDIKAHFNNSAPSPTHSMEGDLSSSMREMKEEIPPTRILDDKKAVEKAVEKAEKAMDFTCNGTSHKNCDHAEKLRALRKNIVRMLSVLTPDLGVENTLDYDSDQVDELLHEVIYSNIEEEEAVKT